MRMALQANPNSFLEELSPLSQALVGAINIGAAAQSDISVQSFYITKGTVNCVKTFASKFFEGLGNSGLSFALGEIRGRRMETFRNAQFLVHDIFDTLSATQIKEHSLLWH